MAAIQIDGAGYPLKDIFSDQFSFNIPNYQRPYAWETEKAERLLDDLIDAMGDNSSDIKSVSPYFLGNIVLIKPLDQPDSEVVDGQQRLITLTILFAVLRHLRNNENLTKYICQPEDEDAGTSARPRLYLRERDREFFKQYIQTTEKLEEINNLSLKTLSEPKQNIIRNTQVLLQEVDKKLPQESQKLRLTQFILQRCYIVAVSTPDFESAYRIFSVINDRGLNLSITDILKADIIGAISSQENLDEDQYTRKWEDLEDSLGREPFTELFSHIRMIYRKSKLSQKVIEEFRQYVLETVSDRSQFFDEVLEPFANAFDDIQKHTFSDNDEGKSEKINQLFRWFKYIDNSDWLPPALLYLRNNRSKVDKLLAFFTDLERLAAGLMIMKVNRTKRIKRYADLLKTIEQQEDLYCLDSPLQLTDEEQKEIINTLSGNLYGIKNVDRYVLFRLDTSLTDGIPNYNSYNVITIEHILPQNPKSDSQWKQLFSDQQRKQYVHCLGNLVLLSRRKNSSAQNYDFAQKKDKYFNSPTAVFALTVQVLKYQQWTPDIIKKRQQELLNRLKQLWRLL